MQETFLQYMISSMITFQNELWFWHVQVSLVKGKL